MPTQWPVPHWKATEAIRAILGPHHPVGALNWCHRSSHDLGGSAKCPSGKHTG